MACLGYAQGLLLCFLFRQAVLQLSSVSVTAQSCGSTTLLPTKPPKKQLNNCGSKSLWVLFICPSMVECFRLLSLFLQVQIN